MAMHSLKGFIFQVISVAVISGFSTYFLGDSLRGRLYPALWILGTPLLIATLLNRGMKRRAGMFVPLTIISVFMSGYILVFFMGYY